MEVSSQYKEIILGSLLGDGSLIISRGYKNARFEMRHSIIQKEYFDWKTKMLEEISSNKSVRVQPADGWSKNEKLHYRSLSQPYLTKLYYLVRHQNRKSIRNK